MNNSNEPHVKRRGWLKNGNPPGDFSKAFRCAAMAKSTKRPCMSPAMPNGRCRIHGGKSAGPKTPEGLKRSRRANWKTGYHSAEAKAERREFLQFLREAKATLMQIKEIV